MYSIEFSKAAEKTLASMPKNVRTMILSKIEALAVDPLGAAQVKKLVNLPGYRMRAGDWRVLFDLEAGQLIVRVLRVSPRGGAYQ